MITNRGQLNNISNHLLKTNHFNMKPTSKLFFKYYLFTSVICALITAFNFYLLGKEISPQVIAFSFFILGGLIALLMVIIQTRGLKKAGVHDFTDENLRLKQKGLVHSNLSLDEIAEELKTNPITKNYKMTETQDSILLKVPMSWESWGEKMEIKLKNRQGEDYEYRISSQPSFGLTLVDYRKNYKNVKNLMKLIQH